VKSSRFVSQECVEAEYDVLPPEVVASVVRPHFDAVRDLFSEYVPAGWKEPLSKLQHVTFVVDSEMHDSPRHFAACRTDGKQLILAPQFVQLPVETLVAILAHEFGHAADFAYPAHWRLMPAGPGVAEWIGEPSETKWGRAWQKTWLGRNKDHVEWTADGIAMAVTGRAIGYCGPCVLQHFDEGVPRPKGLR
jgi:hypothetical protein